MSIDFEAKFVSSMLGCLGICVLFWYMKEKEWMTESVINLPLKMLAHGGFFICMLAWVPILVMAFVANTWVSKVLAILVALGTISQLYQFYYVGDGQIFGESSSAPYESRWDRLGDYLLGLIFPVYLYGSVLIGGIMTIFLTVNLIRKR